jgi:alanine-glyoxylate transaminase / serine-glyoxylate transaminase / serine-pyruvate transaminase
MEAYEGGGHAYYATLPTDALVRLRDTMKQTEAFGFERARTAQQELGDKVRAMIAAKGIRSVAADGFGAPGVVVSYTEDPDLQSGKAFARLGLQTAAGVPLRCDEPADFRTFRIGLFGLDKLQHVDRTVQHLERALRELVSPAQATARML